MIVRGGLPADNYTITSNRAIEDKSVSLKARMLLIYLLSRPPGWTTSAERLATVVSDKDGLSAIKTGLRELEQAGYLIRSRSRGENGRWRWDHTITDRPSVENRPPENAFSQVSEPDGMRFPQETVGQDDVENMQSTIGGKSTDGSSTDGKPSDISKTESTKTETSRSASAPSSVVPPSSSAPASRGAASLKDRMAESRRLGKSVGEHLAEIRESLGWAPSMPDLIRAEKKWGWASGGWRSVEVARDYVMHCRGKNWTPNEDGWWRSMEYEDQARDRRTKGRAYAPNGVPL